MLSRILGDIAKAMRSSADVLGILGGFMDSLKYERSLRERPRGVVEIDAKRFSRAIVVGDIHGDLETLAQILETLDLERSLDERTIMIFLGDYVDRGDKQVETLLLVARLKSIYGDRIVTLRGNHEPPDTLPVYPHDFPRVLRSLYGPEGDRIYREAKKIFDLLPYAAVYRDKAVFLHGGIPVLSTIGCERGYRCILDADGSEKTLEEILWNDPTEDPVIEYAPSPRGAGYLWGEAVTRIFIEKTGLGYIVRGHEPAWEGYKLNHGSRVITIFSRRGPPYYNAYAAALVIDFQSFKGFSREHLLIL